MDEELFDLLLAYLPDSFEGWIGATIVICAVLGAIWPRPAENAHPFWKGLHTIVNAIGFNVRHAKNIQTRQKKTKMGNQTREKATGIIGGLFKRNERGGL